MGHFLVFYIYIYIYMCVCVCVCVCVYVCVCVCVCVRNIILCLVYVSAFISFLGLHTFVEMCTSGMVSSEGINLVPLFCYDVKLAFLLFL